jgi:hypothetical protein
METAWGTLECLTWLAMRGFCCNGWLRTNALLQHLELINSTVAIAEQIAGIGFPLSGVVYFSTKIFYIINMGYGCITISVISRE